MRNGEERRKENNVMEEEIRGLGKKEKLKEKNGEKIEEKEKENWKWKRKVDR